MKRYQNLILMGLVVFLVVLPLWTVKQPAPGPDGNETEIFGGADGQAKDLVNKIIPGYEPWFDSLMEPPSGEIESLLFALQAALGTGFIGFWFGTVRTRAKYETESRKTARC